MQLPKFAWKMGAGGSKGQELCPILEAQPDPPGPVTLLGTSSIPKPPSLLPQNPREEGGVVQSAPPLLQAKVIRFYKLLIYLTKDPLLSLASAAY